MNRPINNRLYNKNQLFSYDLSYEERLARMDPEPLEIRRLKSGLVLHFNISKGLTPFDHELVFTYGQSTRVNRSHNQNLLVKPYCRTKVMENDFLLDE